VVGSPTIPTASNLTRTKVRELIDGFAEHIFWMARWKTVPDGLSIGASRWPALLKLNEKALAVPGGCNEPEFGPCALVTATLRTDWGLSDYIALICHSVLDYGPVSRTQLEFPVKIVEER